MITEARRFYTLKQYLSRRVYDKKQVLQNFCILCVKIDHICQKLAVKILCICTQNINSTFLFKIIALKKKWQTSLESVA